MNLISISDFGNLPPLASDYADQNDNHETDANFSALLMAFCAAPQQIPQLKLSVASDNLLAETVGAKDSSLLNSANKSEILTPEIVKIEKNVVQTKLDSGQNLVDKNPEIALQTNEQQFPAKKDSLTDYEFFQLNQIPQNEQGDFTHDNKFPLTKNSISDSEILSTKNFDYSPSKLNFKLDNLNSQFVNKEITDYFPSQLNSHSTNNAIIPEVNTIPELTKINSELAVKTNENRFSSQEVSLTDGEMLQFAQIPETDNKDFVVSDKNQKLSDINKYFDSDKETQKINDNNIDDSPVKLTSQLANKEIIDYLPQLDSQSYNNIPSDKNQKLNDVNKYLDSGNGIQKINDVNIDGSLAKLDSQSDNKEIVLEKSVDSALVETTASNQSKPVTVDNSQATDAKLLTRIQDLPNKLNLIQTTNLERFQSKVKFDVLSEKKSEPRNERLSSSAVSRTFQAIFETPSEKVPASYSAASNLIETEQTITAPKIEIRSDETTNFENGTSEKSLLTSIQNLHLKELISAAPDNEKQKALFKQISNAVIELADKTAQAREPQIIKLRLRPAELGTIEIKLEKTEGGKISASLITQSESTHHILSEDISQLRESLQRAGCKIETLEITHNSFSAANSGGGFNQSQSQTTPAKQERAFTNSSNRQPETESSNASEITAGDNHHLISVRA